MRIDNVVRALLGVLLGAGLYFGFVFSALANDMRGLSSVLAALLVAALSLAVVVAVRSRVLLSVAASVTVLVMWLAAAVVTSGPVFPVSLAIAPTELFAYVTQTLLPLCVGVVMLAIAVLPTTFRPAPASVSARGLTPREH